MATLTPGTRAPAFELTGVDRKKYSLSNLKAGDLAVVAFFKATCPTCMLAMPFVDKLFRHHKPSDGVHILSVAQETEREAKEFIAEYDLKLPVALDESPYRVSEQYALTNVPTVFLVNSDQTIEKTLIGFVKKEYEELARRIGKIVKKPGFDLFGGVQVPELKPG